jgi:cell division protein FtsN
MARLVILGCLALLMGTADADAQTPVRTTDPVFVRAQQLVSDGNGAAGRAVIDSVIAANSPTSRIFPQALYWRASLAASAADAESDYKHIVVDYPLAPEAEDALLRLAQLELARGDRDGALAHLQRIPRDYPRSKSLARSSYWTARVYFEKNDLANACAANTAALAQLGADEVELQNQIQYQGQRCVAFNASRAVQTPPTPGGSTTAGGSINASSTTLPPAQTPTVVAKDTATATRATSVASSDSSPAVVAAPRPRPSPIANDAKPSIADPAASSRKSAQKSGNVSATPAEASTKATTGTYSVQVAAYNRRADAEKLVATLKERGYEARVDGEIAPFRVRIGRYASSNDAEDALKRIKAKRMDGFVVRAPER